MTAPVDVRRVLRRMQHTCDLDRRDNQIDGLANLDAELAGEESEAIAAVAELIEAAAAEHARAARPLCGAGADSYDRLAAALARLGGA